MHIFSYLIKIIKRQTKVGIGFVVFLLLYSCGKSPIEIDERTYEPKIVINGFLYPNQPVRNIKIARNFPVGATINLSEAEIPDAKVTITDVVQQKIFKLEWNNISKTYNYWLNDLKIEPGRSYRLDVSAVVAGKNLHASSTTTIPTNLGFGIDPSQSLGDTVLYRWRDEWGNISYPKIAYRQGATDNLNDAQFFALSLTAQDADLTTFIKNNPFGFDLEKTLKENEYFTIEQIQYRDQWARPEKAAADHVTYFELYWFNIWFYGRYRAIIYAGDKNFFHYYSTHNRLMDMDGNLHEPLFDIEGDGIGVFGSALADSIYFYVK